MPLHHLAIQSGAAAAGADNSKWCAFEVFHLVPVRVLMLISCGDRKAGIPPNKKGPISRFSTLICTLHAHIDA